MSEHQTLLENEAGSIVTDGPFVLICDCPGGFLEPFVRLVSPIAMTAAIILAIIVGLRAAPSPLITISIAWTIGVIVANVLVRNNLRKHGQIRVDAEKSEIVQHGRGFSRTFSFEQLMRVSTPVVAGLEGEETEPGFEPRWLLVELSDGVQLRLGKGPMHELRPTLAFLRKAGVKL